MSDPKTIYVVTAGSYSDYHIVGVFDDGALADQFVALRQRGDRSDLSVESYDLNPFREAIAANVKTWRILYTHDGEEHIDGFLPGFDGWSIEPESFKDFDPQPHHARDWAYVCTTTCETQEQAVKVCGERKAQFLAERAGIA